MDIEEQVYQNAQKWVDHYNPDGNPDIEKIQAELDKRTYEGESVIAFVARDPEEARSILKDVKQELLDDGNDSNEVEELISNAYSCVWDYFIITYFESAALAVEEKDMNFEGADFIKQSLFEAYKAGLGYVINLGGLLIGICMPEAHQDDDGELHCENGPAFVWGDSVREFWWHGVKVQEDWIMNPESVDPSLCINHPNVEERRALCEILGWEYLLQQLDPRVIDKDVDPQIGELLEVDLPDGGPQRFLRVLEESTGRQFVLLAPNNADTALDAQAEMAQIPAEFLRDGFVRT